MVYKIYYYNEKREKVEFKTITETEYLDIKQMMSDVQLMMSEIDYYLMLKDNAKELAEEINKGKRDENKFNDLNRKLMNLLNSFYAWVEFYQHNYKDVFNALKSNYYDTYFEYRLAYSLRKYTTHTKIMKTILLNTQPRQDDIMDTVIESEDNSVRTRIGYILMKANDKVLMVIQPAIK